MTNTTIDALNTTENIFNVAAAMQPAAEATPSKKDRRRWTVGNNTSVFREGKPTQEAVHFIELVENTVGRPRAMHYNALVGSQKDMEKAADVLNGVSSGCVFDNVVHAIGYVGPIRESWQVNIRITSFSALLEQWADPCEPTPFNPEGGYFTGAVFVAYTHDDQEVFLLDGMHGEGAWQAKPGLGTDWLFYIY